LIDPSTINNNDIKKIVLIKGKECKSKKIAEKSAIEELFTNQQSLTDFMKYLNILKNNRNMFAF
jgi:hypothetical protein